MKKNTLLIIVGAVAVYYLWKKSQEETTSGFSNVGGTGHRTKGRCTVEINTNNTKYKCKGKYVNGVCQPCGGNVVNYATDPNWEAQSVFSRLR